jgi:hypothetical protein
MPMTRLLVSAVRSCPAFSSASTRAWLRSSASSWWVRSDRQPAGDLLRTGPSRQQHHWDSGPFGGRSHRRDEIQPARPRQHDVAQDEVRHALDLERARRVGDGDHAPAVVGEQARQVSAQVIVVLDEQQHRLALFRSRPRQVRGHVQDVRRLALGQQAAGGPSQRQLRPQGGLATHQGGWDADRERASPPGVALEGDLAALGLDEILDQG